MNETLTRVVNSKVLVPAGVGIISFGSGLLAGYILGKRHKIELHDVPEQLKLDLDEHDLADLHIVREYHDLVKEYDGSPSSEVIDTQAVETIVVSPSVAVKPEIEDFLAKRMRSNVDEQIIEMADVELPDPIIENIFAATGNGWNYEEEVKKRTTRAPYVLHQDEFFAVENEDYIQVQMTYYAGDDIMTDTDEDPVVGYHNLTGELKFGHGSNDPNVVYIRNDRRKTEYEIVRDPDQYMVKIQGMDPEDSDRAKHVRHSAVPKFRTD